MVMVRLTSTSGQIAYQDIVANARSIYLMTDVEGAILQPLEWHVLGTQVVNGVTAKDHWQDSFELIYDLPQDVALSGATLLLVDTDGFPYTAFIVPADGAEVAPEATAEPSPTPEPAPTPVPTPEQLAADFLNRLLSGKAQTETDPWTQAILEAGAENVTIGDGALTFALRSFNPGLKSITETEPGRFHAPSVPERVRPRPCVFAAGDHRGRLCREGRGRQRLDQGGPEGRGPIQESV